MKHSRCRWLWSSSWSSVSSPLGPFSTPGNLIAIAITEAINDDANGGVADDDVATDSNLDVAVDDDDSDYYYY